ncbi:hypothetical protein HELRODRAFT_165613 [Helobdella robusta]|uniref:Uncharacterized protein n=1 Tax=Helobdella robusta TaxID=6412 RepID=T1EX29_HELRO|nr:hypothetical protein HELRODRAFT_165613 [Helobdella robusta]ESN91561.1 hypothetical protein HELRODRAFT_165613 [Helobdella robusta]
MKVSLCHNLDYHMVKSLESPSDMMTSSAVAAAAQTSSSLSSLLLLPPSFPVSRRCDFYYEKFEMIAREGLLYYKDCEILGDGDIKRLGRLSSSGCIEEYLDWGVPGVTKIQRKCFSVFQDGFQKRATSLRYPSKKVPKLKNAVFRQKPNCPLPQQKLQPQTDENLNKLKDQQECQTSREPVVEVKDCTRSCDHDHAIDINNNTNSIDVVCTDAVEVESSKTDIVAEAKATVPDTHNRTCCKEIALCKNIQNSSRRLLERLSYMSNSRRQQRLQKQLLKPQLQHTQHVHHQQLNSSQTKSLPLNLTSHPEETGHLEEQHLQQHQSRTHQRHSYHCTSQQQHNSKLLSHQQSQLHNTPKPQQSAQQHLHIGQTQIIMNNTTTNIYPTGDCTNNTNASINYGKNLGDIDDMRNSDENNNNCINKLDRSCNSYDINANSINHNDINDTNISSKINDKDINADDTNMTLQRYRTVRYKKGRSFKSGLNRKESMLQKITGKHGWTLFLSCRDIFFTGLYFIK